MFLYKILLLSCTVVVLTVSQHSVGTGRHGYGSYTGTLGGYASKSRSDENGYEFQREGGGYQYVRTGGYYRPPPELLPQTGPALPPAFPQPTSQAFPQTIPQVPPEPVQQVLPQPQSPVLPPPAPQVLSPPIPQTISPSFPTVLPQILAYCDPRIHAYNGPFHVHRERYTPGTPIYSTVGATVFGGRPPRGSQVYRSVYTGGYYDAYHHPLVSYRTAYRGPSYQIDTPRRYDGQLLTPTGLYGGYGLGYGRRSRYPGAAGYGAQFGYGIGYRSRPY